MLFCCAGVAARGEKRDCRAIARGIHPGWRRAGPRLEGEVMTRDEQGGYKIWTIVAGERRFLSS